MFVFYGEKNKSYRLRDHFKVSKTTTEETEDEFINATQEEQSGVIINAENSSDYQDFLSFSRDAYKPQNKFECLDGEHSDDDDVSEDVSFETCSTFYSRSEASIASINEEEEEEEIEIKDEVDEPKFNDESKVFANEHYVANTVCAEPPVFGIFGRSFPLSRVCSDATVVPSLEPEIVEDKLPPPPTPPPATASKIRKRDYLYNYFHSSKNKNQVENEETIFTTDEVNDESNNNENNTEEEKTVAESQDITHEDDIQSTDGAENHQLDTNPSYFPSFLRKNLFYQAPTSAGNSIAETIIDREALRKELLASLGEGERREAEERYGAYFQEKQAVKELRDSFVEQTNHAGKWVSGFFNRRAALPTFRKATKEIEQVESESETPEPEPEPEYDYESNKDPNPFFMPDEPPIEFNEDLLRPSASIDREPIDDVDMNKYKRHVTMEEIDAEIEQYEKQKQLKKQLEELEQQEFEQRQLEQTPDDVNSFFDRSDFESLDENSRFEDKEIAHKENIREHWSLHTKQTIKDKFSQLLDYPGYLSGSKESNHQKYVVERQEYNHYEDAKRIMGLIYGDKWDEIIKEIEQVDEEDVEQVDEDDVEQVETQIVQDDESEIDVNYYPGSENTSPANNQIVEIPDFTNDDHVSIEDENEYFGEERESSSVYEEFVEQKFEVQEVQVASNEIDYEPFGEERESSSVFEDFVEQQLEVQEVEEDKDKNEVDVAVAVGAEVDAEVEVPYLSVFSETSNQLDTENNSFANNTINSNNFAINENNDNDNDNNETLKVEEPVATVITTDEETSTAKKTRKPRKPKTKSRFRWGKSTGSSRHRFSNYFKRHSISDKPQIENRPITPIIIELKPPSRFERFEEFAGRAYLDIKTSFFQWRVRHGYLPRSHFDMIFAGPSSDIEIDQSNFYTPNPITDVIDKFPFPEEKTTKPFKPIRLTKTTKQVKHSRPFGSNKKDKTIVVIQEDEPVDFNEDDETIEVKNDDEGMSLNSASLIISDIDSYLQELSAGSGCKEWKKTNHSGNNSSTPGLNIAPLVAESSNHFEDSCSIKQTNSNGYHQFKESGIPTDYCVEEDNNFMRDFQEAPTFGKMEHYIGSQMYNGKTIQENPFEINNISSSNSSIQEDIQAQVEYYKFIKDENKKINYITRNYISWKDWNHEYHGFSRRSNSPRDEIQHDIDLFDDKYRKYIANENERISNLNKVEQVEPQVEFQVEKEIKHIELQVEKVNEQVEPQVEKEIKQIEPQVKKEIEQVEQEIEQVEPQIEKIIEQVEIEIEQAEKEIEQVEPQVEQTEYEIEQVEKEIEQAEYEIEQAEDEIELAEVEIEIEKVDNTEADDKLQDITSFITSSEKEFKFEIPLPQDYSSSIDISKFVETEFKDNPITIGQNEITATMNSPIEIEDDEHNEDDEDDENNVESPVLPYSTTLDASNNIPRKEIFLPLVTATHETSSGFENAEFTPNMLICIQQMEEEDRELERLQDEQDKFIAIKIHDMEYQIDEEKFEKKMNEWRQREAETSKQEKIYLEKVRASLLGLDKDENVKPLKGFEQQQKQKQQHDLIRKRKIQDVESASESDDSDFELLGNWFAEGTKIGVSNDSADEYSKGNEEKAYNFDIEGTKIGVSNDSADKYSEGIDKLEEDKADNSDTEGAEIGVSCDSADKYAEVDSIAESKEIRENSVETEDKAENSDTEGAEIGVFCDSVDEYLKSKNLVNPFAEFEEKYAGLIIEDTEIGVSCDSADECLKPKKSVNPVVASAKSAKSEGNKFQKNFNNWLDKDWSDEDTEIGGFNSKAKPADEYFNYSEISQEEDESDDESEVKSEEYEYSDEKIIKFSDMDAIFGPPTKFFEQKPTVAVAKDPIESYEKSDEYYRDAFGDDYDAPVEVQSVAEFFRKFSERSNRRKSATEHFSDSEDEAQETDEVDEPSGSEDEEEMQVYSDLDDEEEEEEEQEGGKEEGEGGKEEGEEKKLEIGTGTALLAAKRAEVIEKVIELLTQVEENKVKVTSREFKEKMELYSNYVNISEFYQFSPLHKDEMSAQEEIEVEVKQKVKSISNPFQFIKNKVLETTNFKSTTQNNTNSNLLNSNDSRISREPTTSNSNKINTNKVFGISINSMWGNISTKYN